jgi:hypothetical protein
MLHRTCDFAPDGICESQTAFQGVRCGFHKKCDGTRYAELLFLQPIRFVGHIVHYGASGLEMSMHYFHALVGPIRFP